MVSMAVDPNEKKALKKAAEWLRSVKQETFTEQPQEALRVKLQKPQQLLKDQQWIDRTGELQDKTLKTRVHRHKSP